MMKNKVSRKTVSVTKVQLHKKRLVKGKYNKFQYWAAKLLKVELLDNHQYLYRVQYNGNTRLKPDDICFTKQGVSLVVLKEENRLAMVTTEHALSAKPNLYGTLTILEKSANDAILNK